MSKDEIVKVGICGLGWLGKALASELAKRGNWRVWGTTRQLATQEQLKQAGHDTHLLSLPSATPISLPTCDVLVINIPPGRGEGRVEAFEKGVEQLSDWAQAQGVSRVIFTSTTGVYGNVLGEVVELTPPNPSTASALAHYRLEQYLRREWGDRLTILRLAGLFGDDRHPVRSLSGRQGIALGGAPVNLISQRDVVASIEAMIEGKGQGETLHLASHDHPSRADYYIQTAIQRGLPLPQFSDQLGHEGKRIDATYSERVLGIRLSRLAIE